MIADVVGDEIGPADLQRVHHLRDVARLRLLLVSALWMGREADASQVGNDHLVLADERRRDRRPHVAGVAEAMDRRTTAGPWPPTRTWIVAPSTLMFSV